MHVYRPDNIIDELLFLVHLLSCTLHFLLHISLSVSFMLQRIIPSIIDFFHYRNDEGFLLSLFYRICCLYIEIMHVFRACP